MSKSSLKMPEDSIQHMLDVPYLLIKGTYMTFVRGKDFKTILVFILPVVFIDGFDIIVDLNDGVSFSHVIHEFLALLFSLGLIVYLLKTNLIKTKQLNEFKKTIAEHTAAFSRAVDEQFVQWTLTSSEKDVALLLIKGLSMKEIASIRNSQESTVRQQAMGIYKKSGLENRQQLSAYFLEDIF